MTRRHVGKETNAQRERFGELSHNFHRQHDGQKPRRYPMRNEILEVVFDPVFFNATDLNHDEGHNG